MRNRRFTALAALAVGAGMVLLGPAAQATPTYPPSTPSISVSATVVNPGTAVTVTGQGFQPVSAVTISWTGPGARGMAAAALPFGTRGLTADTSGTVTTSITFTAAGQHVISLTGTDTAGAPVTLSATVSVVAVAAGGGGTQLSHTGFPVLPAMLAALGLLVLGTLIVLVVRRRRAAAAAVAAPAAAQRPLQPTP
jgi:hypothetical protein